MDHPINLPPLNVATLLRQHGLRPEKSLGQNFLVDQRTIEKIIEAAQLSTDDLVLEIGAGVGNLTRFLAVASNKVVAVEIDNRLWPVLSQVVDPFNNVTIIKGDIMDFDPSLLFSKSDQIRNYIVVANIPYYITSAVIRHLLESKPRPTRLFLTVQKEVAERICARAGQLSLLALSVQVFGHPEIVFHIRAGSFYPTPKVDSSLVKIQIEPKPHISEDRLTGFFKLARAGFSQKRKKLRNALVSGLGLSLDMVNSLLLGAHIDPSRRAQMLTLEEWTKLTNEYYATQLFIEEDQTKKTLSDEL